MEFYLFGIRYCRKCDNLKAEHEFYRDIRDRALQPCRRCKLDYGATRPSTPYVSTEATRAYHRAYYRKNKHKPQRRARSAVKQAIIRGELKPLPQAECEDCGEVAQHYHHTHGYLEKDWLKVVPLCRSCHVVRHKR